MAYFSVKWDLEPWFKLLCLLCCGGSGGGRQFNRSKFWPNFILIQDCLWFVFTSFCLLYCSSCHKFCNYRSWPMMYCNWQVLASTSSLRTGGFCQGKFLMPHTLADGKYCIWILEQMPQCCSAVLSAPCLCHIQLYCILFKFLQQHCNLSSWRWHLVGQPVCKNLLL